jgi:hypothetical protein
MVTCYEELEIMDLIKIVLLAAPLLCVGLGFMLNRTQLAEARIKDDCKQGRGVKA